MMVQTRDPEKTRHDLLHAAFGEMYRVGFQAASLERILASAGVTKGALYHHFKNKTELGYAVVDEVIALWVQKRWVRPLAEDGDPIDLIKETLRSNTEWAFESGYIANGCPLNNLAQEMSPLDEGFRTRIHDAFATWRGAFTDVLRRGQAEGVIRDDIDAAQTGMFILATLEGMIGIAKNAPTEVSPEQFGPFFFFLDTLRANAVQAA